MVKTLLAALKASGCPVDLKRHLVSFYHHKFEMWAARILLYILTKTSTRFVRCANLDQRYNMLEATIQR